MTTLLFLIEKAWEEGILPEFISEYVASGCGSLKDIEKEVSKSVHVTEVDYNNAVKQLEMKNMLPNKIDPYKQFVEVYNAGYLYDDFELKNMLAAIYFPHMGNPVWDNAYNKILTNFESLKDQRKDAQYNKYKSEKKAEVNRMINEALDSNIMTIQDLLSAEIDNVSEEGLDADIKLYQFIASKLGVKDYDKLYVAVDDGDYNPEWVLEDGLMIPYLDYKLFMYPSSQMVAEFNSNGNIFMYFVTEEDADRYFNLAKKFLDGFDVDENQFYDDKHAEEWMDRNPHGYYNDESDYGTDVNESVKRSKKRWSTKSEEPKLEECNLSNLQETLNKRDIRSNNKYDLLNSYLNEHYSLASRKELVERINNGISDAELSALLLKEDIDELAAVDAETKIITDVDDLENLVSVNDSVIIQDKDLLDKAVDYLVSNGIDYDIDSFNNEYRLTWYVGVDKENTENTNVKIATDMKQALEEVIAMLDEITRSGEPQRAAFYNAQYIKQTLSELVLTCDKFDY